MSHASQMCSTVHRPSIHFAADGRHRSRILGTRREYVEPGPGRLDLHQVLPSVIAPLDGPLRTDPGYAGAVASLGHPRCNHDNGGGRNQPRCKVMTWSERALTAAEHHRSEAVHLSSPS